MKTNSGRRSWWVAGAGAVLLGVLIALLAEPEPRFEGRRLSDWLDDPELSEAEITRAVRAVGTNGLPQLQAWLVARPGVFERTARRLDAKLDYLGIGFHPSLDARFRAMRGFLALGEIAAPAVPWLEERARREDEDFEFYLTALVGCGPVGWEAFDRLEDRAVAINRRALFDALAFGTTRSSRFTPKLARYLDHPELEVRRDACVAVRLMRAKCPPPLWDALQERSRREPDLELRSLMVKFAAELTGEIAAEKGSQVATEAPP